MLLDTNKIFISDDKIILAKVYSPYLASIRTPRENGKTLIVFLFFFVDIV